MRRAIPLLLLVAVILSAAEGQRSLDDPFGRSNSFGLTTVTDKVVLEDGSQPSGALLVMVDPRSRDFCRVKTVFGSGVVQFEVRQLDSRGLAPCYISIYLSGYERATGVATPGAVFKLYRAGMHEGSTVSAAALNVPADARAAYEKGEAAMAKKKWGAAEEQFRAAISLYPKYAVAWSELGADLEREGRLDEAGAAFQSALKADAGYMKASVQLTELAGKQEHWEQEHAEAERLLARHAPEFPGLAFYAGEADYHLGRPKDAEARLREAIEADTHGEFPQARFLLGQLLRQSGDAKGAREQFRSYLKLAPHGEYAEQARQQISELKHSG